MKVTFKYPTGIPANEIVTGLKGIITSRLVMLNGCIQYAIQPKCDAKGNTIYDSVFADEQIVSPVSKKKFTPEVIDFVFAPGDRVRNRLSGFVGIVKYSIHDMNNCQRIEVVGELNVKEGKVPFSSGIIQEFEYIDAGLNAVEKEYKSLTLKDVKEKVLATGAKFNPNKKTGTGCASRRVSAYNRED